MKRTLLITAAMSLTLFGCNQQGADTKSAGQPEVKAEKTAAVSQQSEKMQLDTEEKRVSYGMGIGLGDRVIQDGIEMNVDAFSQGVRDAVEGGERLMSAEEIMQEMQAFQMKQVAKQQAIMEAEAAKNREEGEKFLAENAKKEGVNTLKSGLQYKVIVEGKGDKPSATDTVEVNYRGTLVDGTEFDSSYKRNASVSFPVNGVIPGWTEALQLMPVGSKWELYIPSDLAYGSTGTRGGPIGADATLIFEVELLSIKEKEQEE